MTRRERLLRSKLAKLDRTMKAALRVREKAHDRAERTMKAIHKLLGIKGSQ